MIHGMSGPTSDGRCVVDASVGVKWVIGEENTSHAELLLEEMDRLLVPDRFYSEVANVLWKRTRRKEASERITETVARDGLAEILALDLRPARGVREERLRHSLDALHECGTSA